MEIFQRIALAFTIIGAINWGLVGVFEFDLVVQIFGSSTAFASKIVYSVIGIAGLINIGLLLAPIDD